MLFHLIISSTKRKTKKESKDSVRSHILVSGDHIFLLVKTEPPKTTWSLCVAGGVSVVKGVLALPSLSSQIDVLDLISKLTRLTSTSLLDYEVAEGGRSAVALALHSTHFQ
jgi:hypothetical protein